MDEFRSLEGAFVHPGQNMAKNKTVRAKGPPTKAVAKGEPKASTPPRDRQTPGHARARELKSSDERIAYLAGLMRELKFERGKTCQQLTTVWGAALTTVQGYAKTASRLVVAEVRDTDDISATIGVGLHWAIREAKKQKDPRAVAHVSDTMATVFGAKAPMKIDLKFAERQFEAFVVAAKEEFPEGVPHTDVFDRICRIIVRLGGLEAPAAGGGGEGEEASCAAGVGGEESEGAAAGPIDVDTPVDR